MAYATSTYLAISAGIMAAGSVGTSIYTMSNQPKMSSTPPPNPSGYISYDDEGNVAGEQYFDENRNRWVYKKAALTPEQEQAKTTLAQIRQKALDALNKTPEEWNIAKNEYVAAYKSSAQRTVDEQYEKSGAALDESLEAKGMTGSKAYADMKSQMSKDKLTADTSIAENAEMAGEQLMSNKKQETLNVLNAVDASKNADYAKALQDEALANNASGSLTAARYGAYNAEQNNALQKWGIETAMNQNLTKTMSDTSRGLAFLYGYGSKGSMGSTPKTYDPSWEKRRALQITGGNHGSRDTA